jgi:hypothetical protein
MVLKRADDDRTRAQLLRALLATASGPRRHRSVSEEVAILNRLLATPLQRASRPTTLFEALGVLNLEAPHSDFLAWLLDGRGPLEGNWLLKRIMQLVAPEIPWDPGVVVDREVQISNGRLDIQVSWASFKLIIENKVWSVEGDQQVARYLEGANIASFVDGRIIYLTPLGLWPASVTPGDRRVAAISYSQLAEIITSELNSLPAKAPRGLVLATEFRDCINRLLKVRSDMSIPQVSESTRIVLANAKRLAEIQESALEEFSEFLDWLFISIEERLRAIIGPTLQRYQGKYVTLYWQPSWRRGEIAYGFYIGFDLDPKKRLFPLRDGPWVGIGAWRLDDLENTEVYRASQSVVDALHPIIVPRWPHAEDVKSPDGGMALWREMKIGVDGDLVSWGDAVTELFVELATELGSVLEKFATDAGHAP